MRQRREFLSIAFGIVVLLHGDLALACQCESGGPFRDRAAHASVVFVGRVREWGKESLFTGQYYPRRMVVDVKSVIKGAEERRVLEITAHGGALCEASITSFPVGSIWAFAPGVRDDDDVYFLTYCGGEQ